MRKYLILILFGIFSFSHLFGQDSSENKIEHPELLVFSDDVRVVQDKTDEFAAGGGYNLFVRKKPGIESILLAETTKDPEGKEDNFAYRAKDYNPINGDEIRYLDGKVLKSKYSLYSLVDSTPEKDEIFGEAFHIFIPNEIIYGYPWERNGSVVIGKGTFINIRAFEKKYADYTGAYLDNPFMFDFRKPPVKDEEDKEEKKEEVVLTDDYNSVAAAKFKEISDFGRGKMNFSKGPENLPDDIMKSLDEIESKDKVDVVFAIDTTGSMKDDLEKLKKVWLPALKEKIKEFKDLRLGLLLYRDYGDSYSYKNLPVRIYDFTDDFDTFSKNILDVKILGKEGGDIPEAVYEALYASMEYYSWRSDAQRKVILIGDAEPHPRPRGLRAITKGLVADMSEKKDIMIDTIILPDNKSERGRR